MAAEKREKIIKIRVSATEFQQLEANKTCKSLATYMREIALNPNVDMFAKKADDDLILQLSKIGNNVNQIARRIHQGDWGPSDKNDILSCLKDVTKEMAEFHDR